MTTWTYFRPTARLVTEATDAGPLYAVQLTEHGQLLDRTVLHRNRHDAENAGQRLAEQWRRTRRWTPGDAATNQGEMK